MDAQLSLPLYEGGDALGGACEVVTEGLEEVNFDVDEPALEAVVDGQIDELVGKVR
jgi:hypothetical protein